MPFSKHEVVPDVIPTAPKNVAKVDYKSGGKWFLNVEIMTQKVILVNFSRSFGEFGKCFDPKVS